MDKLKPILTHRFWILAGLALLLPVIGWWSSTSAMVSEFKQRSTDLDGAFTSAKLQPGPNQKWIEPIKVLNGEETHKVEETRTLLWDHQLPLMAEWPEKISKEMKGLDPKAEIDARVRNMYRTLYGMEITRLWRIPKPYDEEEKTGRVIFPFEVLPRETWDQQPFPPSTKVMRDSQEDIWLLQALLEAIDQVNEDNGAPNLMDAAIRSINVIQLRGGNKNKPKAAAAPAGPAGAAGAKSAGPSMPMPKGSGPTAMGGMGQTTAGAAAPGADGAVIDLTEVFGPDEETAATTGPAPGGNAPRPPGPGPASGGAPGGGHGGGPAPAPAGGLSVMGGRGDAPKKRYIEENDQYRTRAFYLVVTMDQMQVPNLITKLSNMPWSAKIVRVHQVDHDRSDVPTSTGTNRGPSSAMGGMGNMGSMPRPAGPRPAGGAHSGGYSAPRPMPTAGGESGGAGAAGAAGAGGNEVTAAMSDPALVDVAIAGIFTLYLPPPPPPPAAPGAPAPAGPTAPGTPAPVATAPATEEAPAEEMPEGEGEPATTEEMPAAADADKGDDAEMEQPEGESEPATETEKGAEKPAGKPKPTAKDEK